MSRPLFWSALILALASLAPSAAAETLVLKSGSKVKASNVEIEDDVVRATLHVDGGTAVVSYRFDRLDPFHLIDLLERHWIVGQSAKDDGAAALEIARVAGRTGLRDEAVVWLARAADIDPALAPQRDEGLEAIRTERVTDAFGVLEDLLRAKYPEKLVAAADEALAGELGLLLTPAEALRMNALRGLAQKLIDRASGPVPAAVAVPKAIPNAPAPGAPALDKKVQAVLDRVDASIGKARASRDKATDPGISNTRARQLLETGAKSLLDGRRRLRELPAPLPAVAVDRAVAIDEALVTTWLDVAELYGEVGRLQTARRYLRSARLLDPESERARDIEQKLQAPPPEAPYEETSLDWLYYPAGYSFLGPRYLSPYPYRRYGYGTLGFRHYRHYGFHIGGHGHHHRHGSHHHGARRVVGRRR